MIMSFLTFCLSCSQLFAKGRLTGLNSVWRPITCHSYEVGALQNTSSLPTNQLDSFESSVSCNAQLLLKL